MKTILKFVTLLFSLLSPAPHYWRKAIHFSVLGNSISLNPNPIPCRSQRASPAP